MKMLLRQLEFRGYMFKGVWEGLISLHFKKAQIDRMSQAFQKTGVPGVRGLGSHPSHGWSPETRECWLQNSVKSPQGSLSYQKLYKDVFVLGVARRKQ